MKTLQSQKDRHWSSFNLSTWSWFLTVCSLILPLSLTSPKIRFLVAILVLIKNFARFSIPFFGSQKPFQRGGSIVFVRRQTRRFVTAQEWPFSSSKHRTSLEHRTISFRSHTSQDRSRNSLKMRPNRKKFSNRMTLSSAYWRQFDGKELKFFGHQKTSATVSLLSFCDVISSLQESSGWDGHGKPR
jgi:hypothetical protein